MDVFNIVFDYRAFTSELFCKMCGIIETHYPIICMKAPGVKVIWFCFYYLVPIVQLYTNTMCFQGLKFTNHYKEP